MDDGSCVVRIQGKDGVSSWGVLRTGSDEGAPVGPDAQTRETNWQAASSSTHSFAGAASAIIGISQTGVEIKL